MKNVATKKRVYGRGPSNPTGTPEDRSRCVVSILDRYHGHAHQCTRERGHGHGPCGLYCRQHAKKLAKESKKEVR